MPDTMMMTGSAGDYKRDYENIIKLNAECKVLSKKLDEYKREEEEKQAKFDGFVRELAELQFERDRLTDNKVRKVLLAVTGRYKKKLDDIDSDRDYAQAQLDLVKYALLDAKENHKRVRKELAQKKRAVKQQRIFLRENYSEEENIYERDIENKNEFIYRVMKEIDEAMSSIQRVVNEIGCLKREDAKRAAQIGGMVAGMIVAPALTSIAIASSSNGMDQDSIAHKCYINALIADMNKEIRDVVSAYDSYKEAYSEVPGYIPVNVSGIIIYDNVTKDELNIYSDKLSSMKRNLSVDKVKFRAEVQ